MIKKSIATIAILLLLSAAGVAVYRTADRANHVDGRLAVTATFYPLYDFARQAGGDKVNVFNMTPPGAEPHDFEPAPKELIKAHDSPVFIYNGVRIEPWVGGFLSDYTHTAIQASSGIDLLDHAAAADPHFWLDPSKAERIVTNIADGLSKVDPANKDYYTANASRYNERLARLDSDFANGLKSCKLDTVISSHNAFSYLGARYNFRVESIAGIEPDEEPSVAKMTELTKLVKQKNIKYIFFETLVSPRLADTIARETGASTLVFDPIEGLSKADQDKGKDYISVQYDNLRNLRAALECN